MEPRRNIGERPSCREMFGRIPSRISQLVERFFYQIGFRIAERPGRWLLGCCLIVVLCLFGLFRFRQEKNPLNLWVPPDSDFVRDTEWLMKTVGEELRLETVLVTGNDVLEPRALVELNELTKRVAAVRSSTEPRIAWTDVCFEIPDVTGYVGEQSADFGTAKEDFFEEEPAARMNQSTFDPSVEIPSNVYCKVFESLPKACLVLGILGIWNYDSRAIAEKTKGEIVEAFDRASSVRGHLIDFAEYLGGVARDDRGRIVSATAVKTQWILRVNYSEVDMDKMGNDAGTADWATESVLAWESSLLRELENSSARFRRNRSDLDLALWYETGRSYGDVSSSTLFEDIDKLAIGVALMSLYVQAILSNFNWVEWRFCLTMAALLCVGGAFVVAVGLCSLFGVPYGPVHTSLPFMLLGLGVDDAFVMMASWEQVVALKSNQLESLSRRVGLMLSHAGAAISVTSLTDVVAFVIGASTILPSLQSFCIYAALGVLVTFLLQITFFVAFFALDMRRSEAKRNGIVPCIVHPNYNPTPVDSTSKISWKIIDRLYSGGVQTAPGKTLVLAVTLILASLGVLGSLRLEQRFDPKWFLPKGSYLSDYFRATAEHYPDQGESGAVYMGEDVDYPVNLPRIISLTERLANMSELKRVEPWPIHFASFVRRNYGVDVKSKQLSQRDFSLHLSKFLFGPSGGKYQRNFRFVDELACGEPTSRILLSSIDFSFRAFSGPEEWVPAMDAVKRATTEANITGLAIAWSKIFGTWVTDKIIAREVVRNLTLALICVMGTTALLIAELQTCFWILLCVLLTLLDVCGFMHYWGLTIDIVSCIGLELAVGLSVDYAAHVAHAFLVAEARADHGADRRARALTAVTHIGAAVVYGAGSTLLALSFLAGSRAYVFQAFFKIFALVIVFGLWHGLLFLPVILSTIGPRGLRRDEKDRARERPGDTELSAPLRAKSTVRCDAGAQF